jgi:hypothetical protein
MSNDSGWGCGCLCVIIGFIVFAAIYDNNGSKSSDSTKSTPTNTYQSPEPIYTPPSYNHIPIQSVPRQQIVTRESTPDDAYSEGYDEGYSQGKSDGRRGYDHGYGYDDSSSYYDYYETKYKEGYEEGYDDGYSEGQSDYDDAQDEEEEDDDY